MIKFKSAVALLAIMACSATSSATYKGDLNADNKVDMDDYAILAHGVAGGIFDSAMDMDNSGRPDIADLHILANLIINEDLIEDNGLNVGIGGWENSGEDWGGAVYTPPRRGLRRIGQDFRLYLGRLYYDFVTNKTKVDVLMEGSDSPSAVLVNMEVPRGVIASNDFISLCSEGLCPDASLIGIPKIKTVGDRDYLRLIIASPTMQNLKMDSDALVTITLAGKDTQGNAGFPDCRAVMAGEEKSMQMNGRNSYGVYWKFIPVSSISFEMEVVVCRPGDRVELKPIILPENATNKDIEYTSSDLSVAGFDEWYNWVLWVEKEGSSVVTAKALDGSGVTGSYIISTIQSGVDAVGGQDNGTIRVYDVYGRHMADCPDQESLESLPSGIFVILDGSHSKKIIIRH